MERRDLQGSHGADTIRRGPGLVKVRPGARTAGRASHLLGRTARNRPATTVEPDQRNRGLTERPDLAPRMPEPFEHGTARSAAVEDSDSTDPPPGHGTDTSGHEDDPAALQRPADGAG